VTFKTILIQRIAYDKASLDPYLYKYRDMLRPIKLTLQYIRFSTNATLSFPLVLFSGHFDELEKLGFQYLGLFLPFSVVASEKNHNQNTIVVVQTISLFIWNGEGTPNCTPNCTVEFGYYYHKLKEISRSF